MLGSEFIVTMDMTDDKIANPNTSSKTAAFTRIFPSLVFSLPISSSSVTEIAILVALKTAPINTEIVQSNPNIKDMTYPKTSGIIAPRVPIIPALYPALRKSLNVK